jgi:hypothetical protein
MRRESRQLHGTEKKKSLNEADAKLCEIVAQHGGVPKDKGEGQQREFWTQVQQAFNVWAGTVQQKPHGSWKASRNRYVRLQRRHHADVSPHKQLWDSLQGVYDVLKAKTRQQ